MGARANTVSVDGETLREQGGCVLRFPRALSLSLLSLLSLCIVTLFYLLCLLVIIHGKRKEVMGLMKVCVRCCSKATVPSWSC